MIKVLKPGFYTSVQDLGRFGFQQFGVPFSGAMDRYAYKMSNALLGNEVNAAVLEITMLGPELLFNKSAVICITGGFMNPMLNNKSIPNNKVIEVKAKSILKFGKLELGCRSYLAVKGGFQIVNIMDSRSMYNGVTKSATIQKGDELNVIKNDFSVSKNYASLKIDTSYINQNDVTVHKGPEFDLLSEIQKEQLLKNFFKISKNNNRMAYQLEESLDNNLEQIITSLVMPGTVQLTPSGKLIILMRDCQTTGGYPRVLQLTESTINIVAQKFVGQTISFRLTE